MIFAVKSVQLQSQTSKMTSRPTPMRPYTIFHQRRSYGFAKRMQRIFFRIRNSSLENISSRKRERYVFKQFQSGVLHFFAGSENATISRKNYFTNLILILQVYEGCSTKFGCSFTTVRLSENGSCNCDSCSKFAFCMILSHNADAYVDIKG